MGVDGLQIVGIGMDKEIPLRNVSRTLGINYRYWWLTMRPVKIIRPLGQYSADCPL